MWISTHTLTWSVTVPSMIPKDDAENFNSHAHVERDRYTIDMEPNSTISTHTLTWSVTLQIAASSSYPIISTHTLTWSVTAIFHIRQESYTFQLTRSRGAWHIPQSILYLHHLFQLTRSRGAWPLTLLLRLLLMVFQLTRSRGAWLVNLLSKLQSLIFQLTRSRGAWLIHFLLFKIIGHFNSHAHVERDVLKLVDNRLNVISTHTLTWSVTWHTSEDNHHRRRFQLTRSRGAWLELVWDFSLLNDFNSHAHVERDHILGYINTAVDISTHTLTWSVTILHRLLVPREKFQLTRSRGAWLSRKIFD